MRISRTARSLALLGAAAALAIGLSACSAGGAEDPKPTTTTEQPAPEETKAADQTKEEACGILTDKVTPAVSEMMTAQAAAATPGQEPDYASAFGVLLTALEGAQSEISNQEVTGALTPAIDVSKKVSDVLKSVDYSSVDPSAADAVSQYQALNAAALESSGVTIEDFTGSLTDLGAVCPIEGL